MNPIVFTCKSDLQVSRSLIFENIQQPDTWDSFSGYGVLPGIQHARYEEKQEQMEGAVINVTNTDGSTHKEKIMDWQPHEFIKVKLYDFSTPLHWFASHFIEHWKFQETSNGELVIRTFYLHPTNVVSRPLVWIISQLLRKAVDRHLLAIATETGDDK